MHSVLSSFSVKAIPRSARELVLESPKESLDGRMLSSEDVPSFTVFDIFVGGGPKIFRIAGNVMKFSYHFFFGIGRDLSARSLICPR